VCAALANLANPPRDCKDPEQKKLMQEELRDLRAKVDSFGSGLPLNEASFPLFWTVCCVCQSMSCQCIVGSLICGFIELLVHCLFGGEVLASGSPELQAWGAEVKCILEGVQAKVEVGAT